ncbi:MAG: hypothetical protein JXP73_17150 [Deltaproteobacteria bacterium]|jgi:hypothetical protein|nr:hypothetical protein [Deltaproteobacteria bacterium]
MLTTKKALLLAAVIGLSASGCGAATSDYMRPVAGPEPMGAPPNKARVVFVRPSSMAYKVIFTIIDQRGYFLGDSTAGARFSVFLDPGEHFFIVWTETTETAKATLAPGRTYYVEVRPKMGIWKARASLWAVNRKSGLMKNIPSYLSDTTVTTPDFAAGQAYLNSLGQELPNAAKQGIETFNGYSPEEKADVTLMPEDGQ